jgi:hypothetical protein
MERPMAALDGIAETAERAGDRLREDSKVDEIAVHEVLDHPEPREERYVNAAAYPKKAIPKQCFGDAASTAK